MQEKKRRIGIDRIFQTVFDFPKERVKRFLPAGIYVQDIKKWVNRVTSEPISLEAYFTPEEQNHCGDRLERYVGRYAAKQAIGQILELDFSPLDISIGSFPSGQPRVNLSSDLKGKMREREIVLSISHDKGLAIAMAIIVPAGNMARIGTDVASYERIFQALQRHDDRFIKKQFTSQEALEAGGDIAKFTQMWAGKEAVAKALGTGLGREGVSWKDIEILTGEEEKKLVVLSGGAAEKAKTLNIQDWFLHYERVDDTGLAFVLAC